MRVTYPKNVFNFDDLKAILTNNEVVQVTFEKTEETGFMISRYRSHFAGYKEQDIIEVCFYESDTYGWNRDVYASEYFNVSAVDSAVKALQERMKNENPHQVSNFALDFDNTFEKE